MAVRERAAQVGKGAASYVLTGLLLGIVIASSLQVVFRYIINKPLPWSEELSRYLMVWLTFVGGAFAFYHKLHLGVDLIVTNLPAKLQRTTALAVNLLIGLFLILIVIQGSALTANNLIQISPAMQIPLAYIYASIPIGAAIMLIAVVDEVLNALRPKRTTHVTTIDMAGNV